MPYISSDEFTSTVLKKIASGDTSVFLNTFFRDFDLTEKYRQEEFDPLSLACNNGHLDVVNILLEMPEVVDNAAYNYNHALRVSAQNGYLDIVKMLLEIPAVLSDATAMRNYSLFASASSGHINVVNRLLEIPEVLVHARDNCNYALRMAAENGHLNVVNRLLEIPGVIAAASAKDNYALRMAAENGHLNVVNRLLEIPWVIAAASANYSNVLCLVGQSGHLNVINRLLEIPSIAVHVSAYDNYALRISAKSGHNEVAYVLAKAQWPRGAVDMPTDLHQFLPGIYQGALIASARKEFEGLVKCWIRGRPSNNTSDVHFPGHDMVLDRARIDKYNAPRTIMQYAGCDDVAKEVDAENRIDYVMNTLLYSSRLHETFKIAYENGQKENKEREGYGGDAITMYNPASRTKLNI
ncbi:MAG: ankyrin repeat domain-containing protein [Francisellaceae bacterium]|nr:ankyrin repeat domain-containing protein [Francisellaceae bacterium]